MKGPGFGTKAGSPIDPVYFSDLTRFEHALLMDIWLSADTIYWRSRARRFAAVGTPACNEISRACWARARFEDAARAEFLETLEDLKRDDHETVADVRWRRSPSERPLRRRRLASGSAA